MGTPEKSYFRRGSGIEKKRFVISLPTEMVERLDGFCKATGTSRSSSVAVALAMTIVPISHQGQKVLCAVGDVDEEGLEEWADRHPERCAASEV